MDSRDMDTVLERASLLNERPEKIGAFISTLMNYIETGETQWFHIGFNAATEFADFTKLFAVDAFDGTRVIRAHYKNEMAYMSELTENANYKGPWTPKRLFDHIADSWMAHVEFVNNFEASFAIEIDETTALVLKMEMDEQPGICTDCWNKNRSDNREHENEYNCGHGVDDTYDAKYSALIMNRSDLENFNWED